MNNIKTFLNRCNPKIKMISFRQCCKKKIPYSCLTERSHKKLKNQNDVLWTNCLRIEKNDFELYIACLSFQYKIIPHISFYEIEIYFRYIWMYLKFPIQTFLVSIELLNKVQKSDDILNGSIDYLKVTKTHWKIPFLLSIMVGRKIIDDDYILNTYYLKLFHKMENRMTSKNLNYYESKILTLLNWETNISNVTYQQNFELYQDELWIRHIVYDIVDYSIN